MTIWEVVTQRNLSYLKFQFKYENEANEAFLQTSYFLKAIDTNKLVSNILGAFFGSFPTKNATENNKQLIEAWY